MKTESLWVAHSPKLKEILSFKNGDTENMEPFKCFEKDNSQLDGRL